LSVSRGGGKKKGHQKGKGGLGGLTDKCRAREGAPREGGRKQPDALSFSLVVENERGVGEKGGNRFCSTGR